MSEQLRRLRRDLEQAWREREEARAREEEAKTREEEAKAREEEAKAREEEAKTREEEAKAREAVERHNNQRTTLLEYLRNCHFDLYQKLALAGKANSSTGYTKVEGKFYPKWLRPWDEFTCIQRQQKFEEIGAVCGERRLFFERSTTENLGASLSRKMAGNENAIDYFEKLAVEDPTWEIVSALMDDEDLHLKYGVTGLRFSNNPRDFTHWTDDDVFVAIPIEDRQLRRRQTGPNKRVASEQRARPPLTRPDGFNIRTHTDGRESLASVYDYKAAHMVASKHVKRTLAKEKLFMEVIQRINRDKSSTSKQLREQEDAEALIAMALTQVFDYMIRYGVAYGYVAAGECLLFLHVDLFEPQTLYCHPCVPSEDVGERSAVADWREHACYTAVAQLTSFCLLSLGSEALQADQLELVLQTAESKLRKWTEPYDGVARLLETGDTDSHAASSSPTTDGSEFKSSAQAADRAPSLRPRSSCGGAPESRRRKEDDEEEGDGPHGDHGGHTRTETGKRKGGSFSSSGEDGEAASPPSKPYCTQACLLGLKRCWDLDNNCPNVDCHRSSGGDSHPIDADKLAQLVEEQLRYSPYRKCRALDSWGKTGSTGVLFKVEVVPYGYTFVAKGTVSGRLQTLTHEGGMYANLNELQGRFVPVHLGLVRLEWGYLLCGGARIVNMMLMSWGGEVLQGVKPDQIDVETECQRASQAVWNEGVVHRDENDCNRLYNEERGCIMMIDFGLAVSRPKTGHRRLLELSGNKRKRQHKNMHQQPKRRFYVKQQSV